MFSRVKSLVRSFQVRRQIKRRTRDCTYCADLALRSYKIALLDLYNNAGPHKRKLILLKIKAGNIWSRKHFMTFFERTLSKHSKLKLEAAEASGYVDIGSMKRVFALWATKHFLE